MLCRSALKSFYHSHFTGKIHHFIPYYPGSISRKAEQELFPDYISKKLTYSSLRVTVPRKAAGNENNTFRRFL